MHDPLPAHAPGTLDVRQPIQLRSRHFTEHKYEYYRWLREQAPVCRAKISVLGVHLVSRYEDCLSLVKDPRFVRNRTTATGGRRMPFPMPKTIALLAQSMILEDEPEHARLRNLVNKAFKPKAVARLEGRIEALTHRLLDEAERQGEVDLIPAYALPIPVTVIGEMVGVPSGDMPRFRDAMRILTSGFSGWSVLRTVLWDLPGAIKLVRQMIACERSDPRDDLLSELIHAEEQGDRLTEDELVSMVFLLIVAGYETTVHLITNAVLTLLEHPDQLARLRAEPDLMDSAVEEIVRFRGPIHGAKPAYATEDVRWHGVTIPRGAATIPVYGAANHDPSAFASPEVFDIARAPNPHLGFGHGIHFCLGAQLARMETKVALRTLLARNPNLRLAVDPDRLRLQRLPLWHRYEALPVALG